MVKRRLMKKMYLLRICQTALSVTDVFKYVDLEIFTILTSLCKPCCNKFGA